MEPAKTSVMCYHGSMIKQVKGLFAHSFVYALGSAIQSIVGFVLTPIYTRHLGPEAFGVLEIINTILSVLVFVLSLGFASALLKNYTLDYQREEKKRKELIGTTFIVLMPFVAIVSILISLAAPAIATATLGNEEFAPLIYITLFTTWVAIMVNVAFAIMRAKEQSKTYTWFILLRFSLALIFNIVIVVVLKQGVAGILFGNLVAQAVVLFSMLPYITKQSAWTFRRAHLNKLLAFGIPIIPASMAQWFMDLSDRYFLRFYASLEEVGVYALGYKIGLIIFIGLVTPFQLAWPTISFKLAARKDAKRFYARVTTYTALVGAMATLTLALFAKEAVSLFGGEAFSRAEPVVWIVALSYVLYGMHFALTPGIHLSKKTSRYPWLLIVPALLNIALNIVMIPRYGMMGAAVSTLFSFALVLVLTYIVSQRYYRVTYEYVRLAKVAMLFVAGMIGAASLPAMATGPGEIAIKCAIIVVFVGALIAIRFFTKGETATLLALTNRFRKQS
jgi:O-antigen/teichoic acid export membrane protein